MKTTLKLSALVVLGLIAAGCASNADVQRAQATANEAKNIALSTQAQFDKYFTKTRYK